MEGERRMFNIKLLVEQTGATAIEYGLICALLAVVSIAAVFTVGQRAESTYAAINMAIAGAGPSSTVGGAGQGSGFTGGNRGGQSGGRGSGSGFTFTP
jgi:pilus assembly protein Flp/PilA